MYSPVIVDKTLARLEKAGHPTTRRSIDESITTSTKLRSIVADDGKMLRSLSSYEQEFVRSEIVLCRSDFRYWAERYGAIDLDAASGIGVAPAKLWTSQIRALELIGKREEEAYEQLEKNGFSDAIRICWTKTRQQGATALGRLITMHRMTTHKNIRAIGASLDETKIAELYNRDKTIIDNLPFFLRPEIEFDVKNAQISFMKSRSRLVFQQANQQAGVGTGQQFDIVHCTEVSLWVYGMRLQFDLMPAIPKSPRTIVIFESTANGRQGYWYDLVQNIRQKESGFETWVICFTPWFFVSEKNRLQPPDGWEPNELTKEHADLIERTSAEYCGYVVRPDRTQLYWWESEYKQNLKLGTLHIFFSNYPATIDQSFQHSGSSALPVQTIDFYRAMADVKKAMPYTPTWLQ